MNYLYFLNNLNKYLTKIIDSYVGICYQELLDLENEIYNKETLILLLADNDSVDGIFTTREKAKRYI